jgi:hypothetical protein
MFFELSSRKVSISLSSRYLYSLSLFLYIYIELDYGALKSIRALCDLRSIINFKSEMINPNRSI